MITKFQFFAKSSLLCIVGTMFCQQTMAQESISLIKKKPSHSFDHIATKSLVILQDIAVKLAASPSSMTTVLLPNGRANAISIGGSMPFGSAAVALTGDGISYAPLAYLDGSLFNISSGSLESIEVINSPSVSAGPTGLVGAINLVSDQINMEHTGGLLDTRYGSDQNKYVDVKYSGKQDLWGGLFSFNRQEGDSYRQNRFGQSGGFEANDLLIRVKELGQHILSSKQNTELKFQYKDYDNNESRFGISSADLAQQPMQRYMATMGDFERQKDLSFHIKHKAILLNNELVTTDLYYNDGNADYLQTIGAQGKYGHDSVNALAKIESAPDSNLKVEKQRLARTYSSWGVGVNIKQEIEGHKLVLGALYHRESLRDKISVDTFTMDTHYALSPLESNDVTANLKDSARVNSIFLTDFWQQQQWQIDLGIRYEQISMRRELTNIVDDKLNANNYNLMLLNGHVKYQYDQYWSFVFSSAQGFLPLRSSTTSIKPMKSLVTRAGAVYHQNGLDFSAIAFYNSFTSIMGSCQQAAACDNAQNNGRGNNIGIELSLNTQWQVGKVLMPLEVIYSYGKAKFSNDFTTGYSGFAVNSGDRFPYTPSNQLWLQFGTLFDQWSINTQLVYRGNQQGWPSTEPLNPYAKINDALVVHLNTAYQLDQSQKLYFNIHNLTNKVYVESFYHAGLMAASDRRFTLGYQLAL